MFKLLLISFLSMFSFAANAEEYFEEVDSGIALKYSEFKGTKFNCGRGYRC